MFAEAKPRTFVCPECGKEFNLKGSRLREWNRRKSRKPQMSGPFCGVDCSSSFNYDRKHKREELAVLNK